ncbi:MAG: hypothetical protein K6A96_00820 [Prevotella sp.]|nr:hypothetical protein [Prevotella sp.]
MQMVKVAWNTAKHAESYSIYRSDNSTSGFYQIAEGITSTSWIDEKPLSDMNYYRVYSVGHGLISNGSTTIEVPTDPEPLGNAAQG